EKRRSHPANCGVVAKCIGLLGEFCGFCLKLPVFFSVPLRLKTLLASCRRPFVVKFTGELDTRTGKIESTLKARQIPPPGASLEH
ncbi:MAG: hypothetical protein ABSF34_19420, partial [Verrucomicrobiota bacterium]